MDTPHAPAVGALPLRARRYYPILVLVYVFSLLVASGMYGTEKEHAEADTDALARERGAVLFRLIELTREWNAQHGGVYVQVTDKTQPNPYLLHPRRDLRTTDGMALTMINPAFMTREIAEVAEQAEGVKFHITSLKPIRPANRADPWETETLQSFEGRAIKERLGFFADGNGVVAGPTYRYMAPLIVKPGCMKCHEVQGYKVGDIRGGISISLPAEKMLAVKEQRLAKAGFNALAAFVLIAGLGHMVAALTRRHMRELEKINQRLEEEVIARTRDLSSANETLSREIAEVEAAHRMLEDSEAKYRAVVEGSQDGIVVIEAGRLVFSNQRMRDLLGYSVDEMDDRDFFDFIAPEDRSWVTERYRRRMDGADVPSAYRVRLLCKDGVTRKTVDLSVVAHSDPDKQTRIVVSLKDVTAKLAAERALQISSTVFTTTTDAIMVADRDKNLIQVNPAFSMITGYAAEEVLGKNPRMLQSGRHDKAFYAEMWDCLDKLGHWEGEIWDRRKNGEAYVAWMSITSMPEADETCTGKYVATFNDITKRKQAEEIILHKANFDALTDLPNRHLFDDRLDSALASARRHKRMFALFYIDLDYFKPVNDTLGHAAGDRLLAEAAQRMLKCVRNDDTLARMGGDEFAVIVTDIDSADEAEEVAARLNEALKRPFKLTEGEVCISGSIGIALYPQNGGNDQMLRKCADQALYEAKAAGRATYRFA